MVAIHLIENLGLMKPVQDKPGEYESGFWYLTPTRAESLVGGQIYFHRKQAESSYLGGTILGIREQPDGQYAGRIIFRFSEDPACTGIHAGSGGWSMEKKIVR